MTEPLSISRPALWQSPAFGTLAVFAFVWLFSAVLSARILPIAWEEHYQIGLNLRQTGALTIDGVASVFRAPGYPVFVAAVLWICDGVSRVFGYAGEISAGTGRACVVFAQAALSGILAASVHAYAARSCRRSVALPLGIMAGVNPYVFSLSAVLSYHQLFLTLTSLSLFVTLSAPRPGAAARGQWFATGLMWGLTSLVKPVALLMPAFAAAAELLKSMRVAIAAFGLMMAGMAVAVAPYVWRNYEATGHAIISTQTGYAFWGSSVEKMAEGKSFLTWQPVWSREGMGIFTKVTGESEYSLAALNRHSVALNTAFLAQAGDNIRAKPSVYLYNAARNFQSNNLNLMHFWPHLVQDRNSVSSAAGRMLADWWLAPLFLLSLTGAVWGLIARDRDARIIVLVYLGMVFAHSISFSTELYTYSRLPMILFAAVLPFRTINNGAAPAFPVLGGTAGPWLAWTVAGWAAVSTLMISGVAG